MVDSLYADRGHVDDPHLWERVAELGLDLERFQRDRRSAQVAERVRRDFESGIRAGVAAPRRCSATAGCPACTLDRDREREF